MGFALSWVAVRGRSSEVVLDELGWRRTGRQEEFPESEAVCAQLRAGWFIVVLNRSMDAHDGTIDLAKLSSGEVATCILEEHVMGSGFTSWKDGKRILAVEHDAQKAFNIWM